MFIHSALLIVGLVIIGYTFASRLFWLRYRLRMTQGYHTFLFTVGFSIIPAALALIALIWVPDSIGSEGVSHLLELAFSIQATPGTSEVFTLLVYGLIIALFLPAAIHYLYCGVTGVDADTLKLHAMYTAEPSPMMAFLLFRSLEYGHPIAITLSDRKVYIGYPAFISSSLFSPHGSDIHITPLISGYRDEKQLFLELTTPYTEVLEELASAEGEHRDSEEFLITIPVSEIVHAHLYDPTLQEAFHRHEESMAAKKVERHV